MPGGNTASDKISNGLLEWLDVIFDQRVHEAGLVALLAAHQAPDQTPVAGVQLVNAGLLLDHLRAIQFEPRLREDHQIAAQAGSDGHPAEATDRAGNDADDGYMPAQRDDFGMDLGDHGLAEIGLLQANAAGFKQKHRHDRLAALTVTPRQLERARDLAGG